MPENYLQRLESGSIMCLAVGHSRWVEGLDNEKAENKILPCRREGVLCTRAVSLEQARKVPVPEATGFRPTKTQIGLSAPLLASRVKGDMLISLKWPPV